jgi:glycosyltransferase involved in cell wall biosynthesis
VNGRNGWLVPKGDSQALAERMIWFLKHPSQIGTMGDESRMLAENRFDVEIVNAKMLEILQVD